jgi:uncharacterized protein YjbJ (UPF0337 family)
MRGLKTGALCCPERRRKTGTIFSNDLEDQTMNKDVLEGKWKQIRGEAKGWWGKLTDDDLERAGGKFDVLAGLLQEKYGYSRQRATEEIDKRVTEYEAKLKKNTVPTPPVK